MNNIIKICKKYSKNFEFYIKNINIQARGMTKSEMLLIYSIIKELNINLIIESGRARGFSTLALAKSLNQKKYNIISIDFDKYSKDVKYSEKILQPYNNVKLIYGDSRKLIPKYIKKDCVILIDGPKGEEALFLAIKLLKNKKVKAIFIHDLTKKVFERNIAETIFKNIYFADDKNFIKNFSYLDNFNKNSHIALIINENMPINMQAYYNYKKYYKNNNITIRKKIKNIIDNNGFFYSLFVKIESWFKKR